MMTCCLLNYCACHTMHEPSLQDDIQPMLSLMMVSSLLHVTCCTAANNTCLQVLEPSLQDDFQTLLSFKGPDADLSVESRSLDGSVWLVAYSRDDAATEYYIYDRCVLQTRRGKPQGFMFVWQITIVEALQLKQQNCMCRTINMPLCRCCAPAPEATSG
jgi:hypothetical protein